MDLHDLCDIDITIVLFGDVFRPQDEHRLICIGDFVVSVAPHNCQNLPANSMDVPSETHHLLILSGRNGVLRNLVVSIECHLLALAVLDTSRQFRCAKAEFWDEILSKKFSHSSVENLPLVLHRLFFCRSYLQAVGKEHGIRVRAEITMKGSDVPLGSCIPRRLLAICPGPLGAKKTRSQYAKHLALPVVGEDGPCPV